MLEKQVRNRHRLRKKEIQKLTHELNETFSSQYELKELNIDSATWGDFEILILKNEVFVLNYTGKFFFTIRGLLKFKPERRYVTVDMGAVKFISNGADVMAPGIVDADSDIKVGDLVWVRDERHHQPLSIGEALMSGPEMVINKSNKAIKTIHYIGDGLWLLKL